MALTAGAVRRLKIWGSTVGGSGGRIIGGFTDQNLMSVTRTLYQCSSYHSGSTVLVCCALSGEAAHKSIAPPAPSTLNPQHTETREQLAKLAFFLYPFARLPYGTVRLRPMPLSTPPEQDICQ